MKTFEGTVISDKMQQTIVVEIVRLVPHKLYKKLMRKSRKYKVDSSGMQVVVGEKVKIAQTRPISKDKHFRLAGVVSASQKKTGGKRE